MSNKFVLKTPHSLTGTGFFWCRLWLVGFCLLFGANAFAQIETIPTPMWEGVQKTEADKSNDQALVDQALNLANGDARSAAISMARIGWQKISEGLPNDAIRRFNLAWLVKPDLPDLFWGFAIASHMRGDELSKVESLFERAGSVFNENPLFLTNRGRVLEERERPELARPWFEAALAINEQFEPAHFGMMRVGMALEDKALETKHRSRFEELTQQKTE